MDQLDSQNARDARVEALWRQLDPDGKGELDLEGLRRGLKRMDHPLKNAHGLLQDVMKAVDTSGDGKIQFEEFRTFVEHTEEELLNLFRSIDRDHNGQIDKDELQAAFKGAGLALPSKKLDQFFSEIDTDKNGEISFEEWRNFLLFLPADEPGLKAVLSYYSATISLTSEGDVNLNEQTIENLGTFSTLLDVFLGSILRIASPPNVRHFSRVMEDTAADLHVNQEGFMAAIGDNNDTDYRQDYEVLEDLDVSVNIKKSWLTIFLPPPGYFAAGAIAGVVSRTSTAPLDRLKVYLIANTGSVENSVNAAKKGNAIAAAKHMGRPLIEATKELWRAGGLRSLFAGNGLNVVKVMPESAIKFGSYEGAKRALAHLEGHGDPMKINPYSQFVAGGLGGMFSQLCVYPLDTLKFRMQCNYEMNGLQGNALIIKTAKQMYQSGGILSAYRGLTMGLVGMFPYSAIDLGTFEFLKVRIVTYKAKKLGLPIDDPDCRPSSLATAGAGACSSAFGASVVYPLNLLRTRLQAQGTVLHPPTYTGVFDCARKTVSKEGFRGLFKGITPNLLKVVPSMSITYVVYENSKRIMHLH